MTSPEANAAPRTLPRYGPRIAQSCDRSDERAAPPVLPDPRDQKEQNSVRQLGAYQRSATEIAIDEENEQNERGKRTGAKPAPAKSGMM